jgi:ADP-ribose pyrophosphatase YjhB (NUDIX family)
MTIYTEQELENVLKFPRPRYTVDCVVYSTQTKKVLLQKRNLAEPAKYFGKYALPGGHVNRGERYADAAVRELKEEMGIELKCPRLIEVYDELFYQNKEVDNRGWRVTVGVSFEINGRLPEVFIDNLEVSGYEWVSVEDILNNKYELAFNHHEIIVDAFGYGLI